MIDAMTYEAIESMARNAYAQRPSLPERIVFTMTALEATKERLFPPSRHRSTRVRKKLIRRFGSEFRMRPCIWRHGDVLYAHPSFKMAMAQQIPVSPNLPW